MSFYYFYILQSSKNGKLYIGSTSNLKRRLKQHNSGNNIATKPNIPYKLVHYQAYSNKKDALECERYFKTTAGWRRLKRMLKNGLINANKVGKQYRILGKEILRLVSPAIEKRAVQSYLDIKRKIVRKLRNW